MRVRVLICILLALIVVAAATQLLGLRSSSASTSAQLMWHAFLFGIPGVLGAVLLAQKRWALMGAVIYGTVGLALDISTLVLDLRSSERQMLVPVLSSFSGLLNFLLIVLGGRAFLDVPLDATPPASRRPNPPSPSAS